MSETGVFLVDNFSSHSIFYSFKLIKNTPMKKLLFLFCIISLCSTFSFAQGDDYYGDNFNSNIYSAAQVVNSIVQPPDVAAFQKVNFIPVSNYTGRANISIPIYTVTAGNIQVPIALSYNTSGVKVSDMASSVGLNWSLNAGGVLSKIVKGMDDFTKPSWGPGPVSPNTPTGWLGYYYPDLHYSLINQGQNPYNDPEPDVFSAEAPGLSTKFVHKSSFTTSVLTPLELEHQGNIIDETIGYIPKSYINEHGTRVNSTSIGFNKIEITNKRGLIYTFGSPDITFYSVNSYRLDKIEDPSTNQIVNFEYEQYSNYFSDNFTNKAHSYGGGAGSQSYSDSSNLNLPYLVTHRLKKIISESGEVEFVYGLNRIDNTGEKALTEIIIKDTNGTIIKRVKLAQSYFESTINSSTPQSKRLRLDRVYEVGSDQSELPGHAFTYNNAYTMPPRNSYAHDFLGYNNGSYASWNTNPVPKYYFKNYKITPFYNSSAIALTGNYSLEANVNYAKTYSLSKITYPTGGENEYDYELNEFYFEGNRQGGGLRIKSQKLLDDKGNEQILDYTYENGRVIKMPTFANFLLKNGTSGSTATTLSQLTSSLGIDTFSSALSQVEFTQGAFVGYEKVTVENRIDNGYTEYTYTSPFSMPNVASTKTYNRLFLHSNTWKKLAPAMLSFERDFLRGKILSEITYTEAGKKRASKEYVYDTKGFSTISLEYLNKSGNHFTDYCYDEYGGYKLNYVGGTGRCGGYLETVALRLQRHLLTRVISKDYQSELISSTGSTLDDLKNTITTIQSYSFDKQYPLLLSETKAVKVCEPTTQGGEQDCEVVQNDYDNTITKTIAYPLLGGTTAQNNQVSSLPFANELIAKNRIATPLEITFNGTSERHVYKNFSNGIIALEKVNFVARDGSITPSDLITKRDAKGRIIEYLKKEGTYVARIYGYENLHYLVAEIVNSTHAAALSALQNSIQTPFNQATLSNDTTLCQMMNELRLALPNTQIMSYTYKKQVGVKSVTDPRGRTTNYYYDPFNRLEKVTDHEGKVMSKNAYHYKNQ